MGPVGGPQSYQEGFNIPPGNREQTGDVGGPTDLLMRGLQRKVVNELPSFAVLRKKKARI